MIENLRIRKPNEADIQRFDDALALGILCLCVLSVVTAAVQLYRQFPLSAVEIQHEFSDAVLPTKFEPRNLLSFQLLPEQTFRFRRVVAKFARLLQLFISIENLCHEFSKLGRFRVYRFFCMKGVFLKSVVEL